MAMLLGSAGPLASAVARRSMISAPRACIRAPIHSLPHSPVSKIARAVETTLARSRHAKANARGLSSSSAPPNVDKGVAYWLLGTGGLVAGMVTIGGLTRLTKSGLSMTDWKVQGSLPPMTHDDWMVEFERYKLFPEWQQRKSMTLDEFKYIFYWEWGHRMFGRVVGVAFTGPLIYFAARGRITPQLRGRMALLFAMGGSQGLVGWWMVRSGLNEKDGGWVKEGQSREVRVSPYRLASHLCMAFSIYSLLLYTAFDVLYPKATQLSLASVPPKIAAKLPALRASAAGTAGVVFVTAMSGAFVAGNDAGCAFNTWPDMDGQFLPDAAVEGQLTPAWRNFFENTALVQFDHRMLAYSSIGAVATTYALARRGNVWAVLPMPTKVAMNGLVGMVTAQAALGISTLLMYVPIELAACHQAGSLVLLSFATLGAHSLRAVPLAAGAPIAAAAAGGAMAGGAGMVLSK